MDEKKLRDEINQTIFDNSITESWIARELNISAQNLNYNLHKANDLPYELYAKIKDLFKKAGYQGKEDHLNELSSLTLQLNQTINFQLSSLTKEVLDDIKDNHLSYAEKNRIRFQIRDLRDKVAKQAEEIEDMLRD